MTKTIDIGQDFSESLTNRNSYQRDGRHSGLEFRESYLKELDDRDSWKNKDCFIILDFSKVKRLGPSWANEAFAYFAQFADPDLILKKIQLINISRVKENIIEIEVKTGYKRG